MIDQHLYQQVAEAIRREIIEGILKPGDPLPSIRQMTIRWKCTPGTIHRAYRELANQQLIASHVGKGTQVIGSLSQRSDLPIRRAALIHRAEAFLLEVLTAGYSTHEVEQALQLALDRWKTIQQTPAPAIKSSLRFYGSHDLALNWAVQSFCTKNPEYTIKTSFTGSLGGLIALAEGKADIAGSHLWDIESDSYNGSYIRKLLPGKKTALFTLVQRRMGLILPQGNPLGIQSLSDLVNPNIIFANRQSGSGTRVWLDSTLNKMAINPAQIPGYLGKERLTHSEVAEDIADQQANAGLGLEAAALAFGLDFIFLTEERYDLVIPFEQIDTPMIQKLMAFLRQEDTKTAISSLGGYNTTHTGELTWVPL